MHIDRRVASLREKALVHVSKAVCSRNEGKFRANINKERPPGRSFIVS